MPYYQQNSLPIERPGFTLLELMVSITIFLIITGMVLVNFRSGQYRDELSGSAELVQSLIREAQTATLSGTVTPVACPGLTTAAAPPAGYGVYVAPVSGQPPTVLEFADCESVSPITYQYAAGDPNFLIVKQATLSSHVYLDPNNLLVGNTPVSSLSIVFDALSEQVKINGSSANDGTITLSHNNIGGAPTVTVNSSTGQVFVTK